MHPNEVKAEPGTCSICGMTLVAGDPMATADYVLRVTTSARARRGRRSSGSWCCTATGQPVKEFGEVQTGSITCSSSAGT
jgi:hypothetical protein